MSNAFTYTGSPTDNLSKVRLLIGDTIESDVLLTDDEINFFITLEPVIFRAASKAAEAIAARFSREHDESIGKTRISFSQKFKQFMDLAKSLKDQASRLGLVNISSGGISVSDKETEVKDTDRTEPFFTRRLHDNPGVNLRGDLLREHS